MRILFVCDGRSPIAMNWIRFFVERRDQVHIASSFEFTPEYEFDSINILPIAFSQFRGKEGMKELAKRRDSLLWKSSLLNFRTGIRRILAPLTISSAASRLSALISEIHPDIVHAMRIPFEGMMAARSLTNYTDVPMVTSVWGNDFTLHAGSTPWMRQATQEVLSRSDGLHTDCQRDQKLARSWGYAGDRPTLVIPGNGGIRTDVFYPPPDESRVDSQAVINPRGFRAYIRNDTFFAAIPKILEKMPKTIFLCPGMASEEVAENWVAQHGLSSAVRLLPKVDHEGMAALFKEAAVAVSPSTHDGTPNTLLEAMACGCYPVAGDLESIREWIEPGVNGSLIDPGNPEELANEVIRALSNRELRKKAARRNTALINDRAEYLSSMVKALDFYRQFLAR